MTIYPCLVEHTFLEFIFFIAKMSGSNHLFELPLFIA